MYQICRSLAYIHGGTGVCHRDIKPQNLLVYLHLLPLLVMVIVHNLAFMIKCSSSQNRVLLKDHCVECGQDTWLKFGVVCDR